MEESKKAQKALQTLLSRQDYLIVQGNDLAKSFGGLKAFEQRVLDYCFSYVQVDDQPDKTYEVSTLEIIKHFKLTNSGDSYKRIAQAFKSLNENTALYLPTLDEDGTRGVRMTQLFSMIEFKANGRVLFEFSKYTAPLVFDLKKNFYSFHLRELSQITGKYSLILLKLWESYRQGNSVITTISGSTEDWQGWFLGKEKRLTASRFYTNILKRATEELEKKLNAECTLMSYKKGRKIVSYELTIVDKTKLVNP
ncbi:replication initiation protein [Lactiplantibacillus plantarum]|uniref:replication initiation protein n=1 Tax=Lactiplantibacillus plantarum TaxID=1590 RepID=UPI000DEC39A3|nr:replication initiation protein [Lactiplantibacillus plantarum]RCI89200.1 replication initiation protein [Lactiplantibacillus plantarum]